MRFFIYFGNAHNPQILLRHPQLSKELEFGELPSYFSGKVRLLGPQSRISLSGSVEAFALSSKVMISQLVHNFCMKFGGHVYH